MMNPRFSSWFSGTFEAALALFFVFLLSNVSLSAPKEKEGAKGESSATTLDGSHWNQLAKEIEADDVHWYVEHFDEAELPPIRWKGDGMDSTFGPAEYDDLQVQYPLDVVGYRRVWNLPAAIAEYERRFAEKPREKKDFQKIPRLSFQWCRIEQFNFAKGGGKKSVQCYLNFLWCQFLGRSLFGGATFKHGIGSSGSTFQRYTGFQDAQLLGGLHLHDSHFEGEVHFEGACIGDILCFRRCRFEESLDLRWVDLRQMTWLDFCGLKFNGRSSLAGDVTMHLSQFRGKILGESQTQPPHYPVFDPYMQIGFLEGAERTRHAAEQYSLLAGNFSGSNEPMVWPTADWCHSRSCDLRRKAAWMDGRYGEWLKAVLWKGIFGNGVDWRYPATLAFALIFGFALVYLTRGKDVDCSNEHRDSANRTLAQVPGFWRRLLTSLYFSVVTFSTLGYGDWRPRRYARAFAAIEALSGPVLMAAIVVIMVRKIIR